MAKVATSEFSDKEPT